MAFLHIINIKFCERMNKIYIKAKSKLSNNKIHIKNFSFKRIEKNINY